MSGDTFSHNILFVTIIAISIVNGCVLWRLNKLHMEMLQLLRVLLTIPGACDGEDDGS